MSDALFLLEFLDRVRDVAALTLGEVEFVQGLLFLLIEVLDFLVSAAVHFVHLYLGQGGIEARQRKSLLSLFMEHVVVSRSELLLLDVRGEVFLLGKPKRSLLAGLCVHRVLLIELALMVGRGGEFSVDQKGVI